MGISGKLQGKGLLPTPTQQDSRIGLKNEGGRKHRKERGSVALADVIYSPEASPVSLFPQQERGEAQQMTVISGRRCCELLRISSPLGSLARTLLASSRWHSSKVSLTWKVKTVLFWRKEQYLLVKDKDSSKRYWKTLKRVDTKSNRLLFQLSPSTLRTEGIGCGLLRTPDTGMDRGPRTKENLTDRYLVRKMPLNLNDQIAMHEKNLLATPQASDATQGAVIGKGDKFYRRKSGRMQKINKNGIDGSVGLAREIAMLPTPKVGAIDDTNARSLRKGNLGAVVFHASLPTPNAHDGHIGYQDRSKKPAQENVETKIRNSTGGRETGLKLQPSFVEWMMGLPIGYTDLRLPDTVSKG
jgi:hypothetical protein